MLLPQLYGNPLADVLSDEASNALRIDIATAWARASGVGLLWDAIDAFLKKGGKLRVVVGLDRDNSSVEGLALLLAFKGDVKIWVRHNESSSAIFHPKLYAFRTISECRVIVGSNNMTGAGLVSNEELSSILVEGRNGQLEKKLKEYMSSLRDTSGNLAKRLNQSLLAELEDAGYVSPEATLRGKSANQARSSIPKKKLFGTKTPPRKGVSKRAPLPNSIEPDVRTPVAGWRRVFIRLRLARGTQGQLPVAIARQIRRRLGEKITDGPINVILRNTNEKRKISPTYAARSPGSANTYKIEAFQPQGDAIMKLELIGSEVVVEQFDTADKTGKAINDFIEAGLKMSPPQTVATTKDLMAATLYRFD